MMEWKKLGDLGQFENIGTDKKIVDGEKSVTLLNYIDVYHHKYIDVTIPQMIVSASDKKIEQCTVEKGDLFVTPSSETIDDIGHSAVITDTIPNAVYSYHIMRFRLFERNLLLSYYINYAFDTELVKKQIFQKAQGLTRFGLSKDKFASIVIPIPSLSEQTRIVGILDTFTSAIDNLKEQIALRRKQYEYYRDQLLDLEGKEGVEMKSLGEISKKISSGKNKSKNSEGLYPVFGSTGIIAYSDEFVFDKPLILVARVGANAGFVHLSYGKYDVTDNTLMIDLLECANQKYIYYNLVREKINKYAKGGGQPLITSSILKNIIIPVPSIEEQSRIVSILDTFEVSIKNLEAQLKEREKQYEYYRNKLLTFE